MKFSSLEKFYYFIGIDLYDKYVYIYYMANPVLGKSLRSDWFFLCQDFAVQSISMEMVQPVYFCFGVKPPNSKFATKTGKKTVNMFLYCVLLLLQFLMKSLKIEIFLKFQRWMKKINIPQASFIILKIWNLLMQKQSDI